MYYISPWVFYVLGVIDTVRGVAGCLIFGIVLFEIFIVCFMVYAWIESEDEWVEKSKRYFSKSIIPLVIASVILIFVPSKETCYQMLIASQVTVENVNGVKETVKEVANYIIEASDKLSGDSKNEE